MKGTVVFTWIVFASAAMSAQARLPGELRDLEDMRAGSGERELEDLGYRHRNTVRAGGNTIDYWWSSREDLCVAVTTKDGHFASLIEQPEVMCDGDRSSSRDDYDRHGGSRNRYREVKENDMGLRKHPDRDSSYVVRGLRRGDRVRVIECEKHHGHDWCRVEFDGEIGWIGEPQLRQADHEDRRHEDWEIGEDGTGLRRHPDRDSSYVVRGLRKGDRVRMIECEEHHDTQWCRVEYRDEVGWVGKRRLRRR